MSEAERLRLVESVRVACVRTALAAYETARIDGLCEEGAFEAAMDAVLALDASLLAGQADEERR